MRLKTSLVGFTAFLMSLSFECPASEKVLGIFGIENPLYFKAWYDIVGASKFRTDPFDGEKLHYSSGVAELSSFVFYDDCRHEGITLGATYMSTHLGWHENPLFHQKNFNSVGLTFNTFSGRWENWLFKGFLNAAVDTEHFDFNNYLLWDFGAYGNYELFPGLGLNFGFYAQTGMKMDRVWPIIGFVYVYSDRIRIDAVFPVDLNLYYKINDSWQFGLGAQFFRTRNRAGRDEPLKRALWVYENSGLDARVNYESSALTYATFHIGYTFGGRLKIADQDYDKRHHYKFDSAPYAGGEFGVKF